MTRLNDENEKMMKMKKKEYMIPTCEVVELETTVMMLSLSLEEGEEWEEGGTYETNRHRGEWGNLWSNIK